MSSTTSPETANRPVAVIGAGTLGRRIAAVFASGGSQVRVIDFSDEQRNAAVEYINENAPKLKERLDGAADIEILPVETFEDSDAESLADVWLVIEAVPERLDIKRPLFGTLDKLAPSDAILATNSSSYRSSQIIDEVKGTERVLNMHFAMPPASMAVEIMSDGETDQSYIDRLVNDLPAFGLLPFVAMEQSTGFIFNRIWAAIKRESLNVVAEGVSTPKDVDDIMKANVGMPQGPFWLMDQVGLDVVLDIENHYAKENPHLPEGPRKLLQKYVDAGDLGQKTGRGFFDYSKDSTESK